MIDNAAFLAPMSALGRMDRFLKVSPGPAPVPDSPDPVLDRPWREAYSTGIAAELGLQVPVYFCVFLFISCIIEFCAFLGQATAGIIEICTFLGQATAEHY